jgi:hypothetical protein
MKNTRTGYLTTSGVIILVVLLLHPLTGISGEGYKAFNRLNYYSGEETGQMVVAVPEGKENMRLKVDLVLDYQFLNRNYPLPSTHGQYVVPYALDTIKSGTHELTVSFYEDDKWVSSAKVSLVKRPGKMNEVKVDRASGALIAYDESFFPVGFYCYWPVDPLLPEEEVVKGFNMVSPYWKIDKGGYRDRMKFMDRCAELGIMVNFNLCSVAGGGGVKGSRNEHLTDEEKRRMLKREVERFRDHPALLSWYIADEPVGQGVPPEELQPDYELIRELDPYHPVSVVFMTPSRAKDYRHCMDIVMTDPYPIPNGSVAETGEVIHLLMEEFRHEKPVWIVPQAFGGNEWWDREPTRQELRVMTWLPVVNGARGIQYFVKDGLKGFPKSTAVWGEAGACALEIKEMQSFLAFGQEVEVVASGSNVKAKGWYHSGMLAVIAVNQSYRPENVMFNIGDDALTGMVELPFENREVMLAEGIFEDMIDGLSVRFYYVQLRENVREERRSQQEQLIIDPGFENDISPAIPAACYFKQGKDRGATCFADRLSVSEGFRSVRLNTPGDGEGLKVSFKHVKLDANRSYTLSIDARKGASPNNFRKKWRLFKKDLWIDNPDDLSARLTMSGETMMFAIEDDWKRYQLMHIPGAGLLRSPELELTGKGTARFDDLTLHPDIQVQTSIDSEEKVIIVEPWTPHNEVTVAYRFDGTGEYLDRLPVRVDRTSTLNLVLLDTSFGQSAGIAGYYDVDFVVHEGLGSEIAYNTLYSEGYPGSGVNTLLDGRVASIDHRDKNWQGFLGDDLNVVIDLGRVKAVDKVRMRFLEDQHVWIFLPATVTISTSTTGWEWSTPVSINMPEDGQRSVRSIQEMDVLLQKKDARYIRISAENIGECPEWHKGAGGKAWIFADEIIIDQK